MELLALLSNNDELIIPDVKNTLKQYTVYPLKTLEELEELYSNIPLNLFLIDTLSHKLSSLGDFLNKLDEDMVVLITQDKMDNFRVANLPKSVFDCIDAGAIKKGLITIVERALERQRFKNEIRLLKQPRSEISTMLSQPVSGRADTEVCARDVSPSRYDLHPGTSGRYIQERVIVNFAKMLTVSFDMRKLFDHFIDSVMEIARVSKMSVMLRDKDGFHVKTNYGLDPYIADNLTLKNNSALVTWLSRTGRIVQKPVTYVDTASVDLRKEMEFLQCSVSFPMIYKGKLIGILNIDNKITEEPFYREELEIIYVLCNYLAAAVKDIDIYHQIWFQKEFTNNILSSMNSGMIAIDKDEKVTIFNQQASEILNLAPAGIIGSDLRALPSPLGDILYETMVTGISYKRYEVTIQPAGLPLGINSYRLTDEQQAPTGAGIVFSDLSDSKKLEEQRRRVENLEAVNDLMAKIAHEVRNPLTSIQTYIQLLQDKHIDNDLNKFYISTVSQSINRLDSLIDKLVTFSSTQDYDFKKIDINNFIDEAENYISQQLPETHKLSRQMFTDKVYYINADKKQLIKAVYYLVLSIIDWTPDGTSITISADRIMQDKTSVEVSIKYSGGETIDSFKESLLKPLLDINHLGTELNVPLSHKIIEGHGGHLDMKNEGDINIFIFTLPVVDSRDINVSIGRSH
ncbi:MAG: GAF domain-containing protein [Nitrospirae bacterium]|nr:GAF domain-containing protein [Nitrospirota bacterium]